MTNPTQAAKIDQFRLFLRERITGISTAAEDDIIRNAEAIIADQCREAAITAVNELRRRWHEDRKTMDYSPATYDFICDQYLAALKEQPHE
jgi:hypothetical protein